MKKINLLISAAVLLLSGACNKTDFLNKKPATNILTPATLTDFQALLDNTVVMNQTGGLDELSSDEYTVSDANFAVASATERNSYIWAKDIYAGDVAIPDWNKLYQQVFYANSVLDGLAQSDSLATSQGQYLKGWALFARAFTFYDLARTFCKAYDSNTANTDLGIPLRLTAGIDQIEQRASLQNTLNQIINDLNVALVLLPSARPAANLNRPSQIAVYALLARIYLDMRMYPQAENNADKCLALYHTLIDFNTVSTTSATPFSVTNDELIYTASQVTAYGFFSPAASFSSGKIPLNMINTYAPQDLRLPIYFGKLTDGTYYRKKGYIGLGNYSFTGLAVDELYLIKAECLARDGQASAAMDELNQLLFRRFNNKATYMPLSAATPEIALSLVLAERYKELIWRGLRWYDLKRLNKEGANISLTRTVNGITYSLPPNDDRWVMPVPSDEIQLSGIQQNPGR